MKGGERNMGYYKSMQKTIEHIENHLGDALCLHDLAQIAGFSDYHFHRVFQTMVGDTVMEYVRKRRLAKAAAEMEHPDRRILDVALDHGFQSHETFTRAFKKLFGITPVEYRRRRIKRPLIRKPTFSAADSILIWEGFTWSIVLKTNLYSS
jgi:AraC family transcriptional regulator